MDRQNFPRLPPNPRIPKRHQRNLQGSPSRYPNNPATKHPHADENVSQKLHLLLQEKRQEKEHSERLLRTLRIYPAIYQVWVLASVFSEPAQIVGGQ